MAHIDDNTLPRLAATRDGAEPFLLKHHLAAAERLERLIERSRITPRVTMSYDPASIGARVRSGNGATDVSDSAAGARQRLSQLAAALPGDCWGVLFDVCGLGKGLQAIETERRWPRRSAKLVLRIGLEQLAAMFGLLPHIAGSAGASTRAWFDERLPLIADAPATQR